MAEGPLVPDYKPVEDPVDFDPADAPRSPEKDLAVDVLLKAIQDLKLPQWRDDVLRWIENDERRFRFRMPFPVCCELAGLNPSVVRAALAAKGTPNDADMAL